MKIAKSILSIGLIIILAFINSSYAEKTDLKDEELFIKAFEETGADFSRINLNFNGTIYELYKDEEQLKNIMYNISKRLGLIELEINPGSENEEYMNVHTESFSSSQLVAHGRDENDNLVTVVLYSYFDKGKDNGETSVVIDITRDIDYLKTKEIAKNIENLYKLYNIKTEITYCIIGTFDAELNKDNMIKKTIKALAVTNGERIEGLVEDDIVSISAYSPNIDRYIYAGNKKMNLNIALSYNEYEGKTYIIMGYPIITIGY